MSFKKNIHKLAVAFLLAYFLAGCSGSTSDISGVSGISGYRVGIRAIYSDLFLPADGTSEALITVEVWDSSNNYVDGVAVSLSVVGGTLASSSLVTANGVASTTFTSSTEGSATVTALVENVSATATITVRKPIAT